MKRILIVLLVFITVCGCSSTNNKPDPGTPKVSPEQAEEIARNVYGLTQIETINIRHLNDSEMEELTEEQLGLTPVYYVVTGIADSEEITAYISSHEVKHHFSIHVQP